jgi:hypothetical protein
VQLCEAQTWIHNIRFPGCCVHRSSSPLQQPFSFDPPTENPLLKVHQRSQRALLRADRPASSSVPRPIMADTSTCGSPTAPLDLSHHYSKATMRRGLNNMKAFYKYFRIPNIGNLAGGLLAPPLSSHSGQNLIQRSLWVFIPKRCRYIQYLHKVVSIEGGQNGWANKLLQIK